MNIENRFFLTVGCLHDALKRACRGFLLITDEPGDPKAPIAGTIGLLSELPVVVSVIGASDPFEKNEAGVGDRPC